MKKLAVFVVTAFLSIGANAACEKPVAPSLPDANSAVTAEMVKAKREVTQFLTDAQSYLDCIGIPAENDQSEVALAIVASYNQMVGVIHTVGDGFNSVVRSYKARKSTAAL